MRVAFATAILILLASGAWYYHAQEKAVREEAIQKLTLIGASKAASIAAWRKERLADAAILARGSSRVTDAALYLEDPTEAHAQPLLSLFQDLQKHFHYANILLLDAAGKIQLSLSPHAGRGKGYAAALAVALREKRPVLTGLYIDEEMEHVPYISTVTPLSRPGAPGDAPFGAIVLMSEAENFLYPLLRSWPVPSATAETALFQRDGDGILFLSDLRHRPGTALRLRIPRASLPTYKAVNGVHSVIAGPDCLGVTAIAYVAPIPGSPWFIVAKEDEKEIFAKWRFRGRLILALLGSLVASLAAIGAALWQRNQNEHYRSQLAAENALRISAERNEITLRAIGDAVIVTDTKGCIELLNPTAELLTGWSEAEARGRLVAEVLTLVNDETHQPQENPVAQVLQKNRIIDLANHSILIAKDGSEHPVADSAAPIHTTDGAINGVVLVLRDQSTAQSYRRLFQCMHAGFALHEIIYDNAGKPIDYRFIDVNPAFEQMTGLKRHDVIGKRVLDVLPDTEPYWIETYGQVVLSGEAVRFTNYSRSMDKYFDVTAYRPQANSFATVFRDITETKHAADALMRSEQKYRSLTDDVLDTTEAGVFILDADFKVVWVNRAMERFFNLQRTDTVGRDKRRLVREKISQIFEDPQAFQARLFATYDNNTYTEKFDCHVLADDGVRQERWLQHWSQPIATGIYAGGRIEHYYDITDLKRAEAGREKVREQLLQSQKMESVGRLAGGVAHDFNNMLSVILGNAELALESLAADAPQQTELQEIVKAAHRSAEIARQLLTFARKQNIAPKALDLNETITDMLTMLRSLCGKEIALTWLPKTATAPIKMDPAQISQILTNLCANARDAIANTGKITIETTLLTFDEAYCATHPDLVPGRYVQLSVSDDGCGIAPDTLPYLFEPFFTTKGAGKGNGLGLATVYGIVKQNNGAIRVTSEKDRGATFNLYLPYHEGAYKGAEPVRDTVIPQGKGETLLVVDDNAAVLTLTALTLKQLGYTVLTANTPADALKIAANNKEKLALLITDVIMPGMNGLELARRLSDLNPTLKCLYMSGYTAPMIARQGIVDSGMSIIQKPFSRQDLAVHVQQALDG